MPAYFNLGAGRNEGAWHGDMPVFTEALRPKEVFTFCGMDEVKYELQPAYSAYKMQDGTMYNIEVPGRFDLWRSPASFDPQPRFIRTVGNRYDPIQPIYLAELLQDVPLDVDTCGVLSDWSINYITMRMEPFEVGGFEQETHNSWLMVSDDKSKVGSAYWGNVIERIVCKNTYNAAKASAREMHAIPHNTDVALELEFRRDLLVHALNQRKQIVASFDAMIKRLLNPDEFETMLVAAFPWEKEPRELELMRLVPDGVTGDAITDMRAKADEKQRWLDRQNDYVNRQRQEAETNLLRFNDEYSYAANTVYAGFNAITQQVNHGDTYRGGPDKQRISVLFGDRASAMGEAFRVAEKLISKN